MRSRFLGIPTVRSLTSVLFAAMGGGLSVASVSAQSAVDSLTRIRIDGSPARRVGTVLRITPDSAFVRILYTERRGPQFADVVFWGTQRLLVDPPRTMHESDVLAFVRTDVRSLERRGERRVWPFTAMGGGLLGAAGLGVYAGGVTPVAVPVHALLVVGGATLGRSIGHSVGQHQWHTVPRADWDRLPP